MLRVLLRRIVLLVLPAISPFVAVPATAQASEGWPGRIEAVRSEWTATEPPAQGWVDVALPDDWTRRWPGYDGVVWYRLSWNEAQANAERAVLLPSTNLAGAVSLAGTELYRDPSLVEPLSRSLNRPVYLRLPSGLLQQGENQLLVRVSGLAFHGPGLARATIGEPEAIFNAYERLRMIRVDAQMYGQAVILTLGGFFVTMWFLRRRETLYGWIAAASLLWWAFTTNELARSPWPFASTDHYVKAISILFLLYCPCSILFLLRFAERRFPRAERALWAATGLGIAVMALTPHADIRPVRNVLLAVPGLLAIGAWSLFCRFAWVDKRAESRFLAAWMSASMLGYVHDMFVFLRLIDDDIYYTAFTTQFGCIGMALAMIWRFAANQKRVEGFNVELQRNVDEARRKLAATLERQHELELRHARLGERVSLAHDLHDGLGGMLIGNIAELEQAPEQISSRKMLDSLRELRDDLRLIIDTASAQQYGEHSLDDLLGPFRHRMTRLFEAHDVGLDWNVIGLENVYPTTTQSLDILRILQEALTNVLKHSGAGHASIDLRREADALNLEICDDGSGFAATDDEGFGTGMRSMRARAQRLGATLTIGSEPGTTVVRLRIPCPR